MARVRARARARASFGVRVRVRVRVRVGAADSACSAWASTLRACLTPCDSSMPAASQSARSPSAAASTMASSAAPGERGERSGSKPVARSVLSVLKSGAGRSADQSHQCQPSHLSGSEFAGSASAGAVATMKIVT